MGGNGGRLPADFREILPGPVIFAVASAIAAFRIAVAFGAELRSTRSCQIGVTHCARTVAKGCRDGLLGVCCGVCCKVLPRNVSQGGFHRHQTGRGTLGGSRSAPQKNLTTSVRTRLWRCVVPRKSTPLPPGPMQASQSRIIRFTTGRSWSQLRAPVPVPQEDQSQHLAGRSGGRRQRG